MKTLALRLALFTSLALTAAACVTDDNYRSRGEGLRPGYKPALTEAAIVPIDEPDDGAIQDPGNPAEPGADSEIRDLIGDRFSDHLGESLAQWAQWAEEVVIDGEPLTVLHFEDGRWQLLDAAGDVVLDRDLGSSN